MKKNILKIIASLNIILVIVLCAREVYALGNGINENILDTVTKQDSTLTGRLDKTFNDVFGQIMTILEVLAVAGIMINGVRYMYADSAAKAKIKQSLIYIIIGTVMVFGAHLVVSLISVTWNSAI